MNQPRSKKVDVHGWVVLDKDLEQTSTHAVSAVRRLFNAKKGGHAGTLDPLATGLLPVALGEATKTVPFVMDGRKTYRFTVTWGSETTTDDTEGEVSQSSDLRPTREAVEALLPRYTGTIMQVPPKFSAVKIAGERAYDLARDGEEVTLEARPISVDSLVLTAFSDVAGEFEAECGKGTYVRAIARDIGRDLGCFGHVTALRRTRVGPFGEDDTVTLEELRELADGKIEGQTIEDALLPVEAALADVPEVKVNRDTAARLARGQSAIVRGRDAPIDGTVWVSVAGDPIAIAEVEQGELVPKRVFVFTN
ncbi:tRNA pseudouridine(55) synthase TruB [Phreatobacter aquaticus]|uniref:tRNA pseudouridine synthase B n=1 Tax=Phreatobacter aquaticus TaxID=2570229 RepID=A0A4D7QCA5_9HYPH|nr:tRNA pseudouridine(55) synthase TruB [Phreatobacter aquaticus]QCK85630.1 tRNA pseudouridine(55) synthase TruB [Phreatobacter aquaticus]